MGIFNRFGKGANQPKSNQSENGTKKSCESGNKKLASGIPLLQDKYDDREDKTQSPKKTNANHSDQDPKKSPTIAESILARADAYALAQARALKQDKKNKPKNDFAEKTRPDNSNGRQATSKPHSAAGALTESIQHTTQITNISDAKRQPTRKPRDKKISDDKKRHTLNPTEPGYQVEYHPNQRVVTKPIGKIRIRQKLYILTPLASGGVCDIYLAKPQADTSPHLALKILKSSWMELEHMRRQFAFEAQILKGLDHPKLPKFVHYGHGRSRSYLAYEFKPGHALISFAQQKKYYGQSQALCTVIQIILDILNQVHYLHTKPGAIVHGDISAENVIFSPTLGAHLMDFGCAHLRNTPPQDSYQWIGKPSYLSPEQARGEPWSAASDIYQIGILAYELVIGKRWLRGTSAKEKMLQAATKNSPAANFIADSAPYGLSKWIADCLHAQPEKRPTNVAELINRLKRIHATC